MKPKIHYSKAGLIFLFLLLSGSFETIAINYTITFSGTGASTTVGEVLVQNLTKGTSVTVPAGNVLNLYDVASAVDQLSVNGQSLRVFPNPLQGKTTLSFFAKQKGNCSIKVFGLDGRCLAGLTENLHVGRYSFFLLLPNGLYTIQVTGSGYSYTAKVISQASTERKPGITFTGNGEKNVLSPRKIKNAITKMLYSTGDQLLYKGTSGDYSTIVTDVPAESKMLNFDFVECRDVDGNNYSVVKIGTQTWMTENLKTKKYRTGDVIPNVVNDTTWWSLTTGALCFYNNNPVSENTYGILYNWLAVNDSRNIAPVGWHVASDAEWATLENYLIANGSNYDGTTADNKIAKSLSAATGWMTCDTIVGATGNNLSKNNSTGFTALPAGNRTCGSVYEHRDYYAYWWSSTELNATQAGGRGISFQASGFYGLVGGKSGGVPVRCVKDSLNE